MGSQSICISRIAVLPIAVLVLREPIYLMGMRHRWLIDWLGGSILGPGCA